jgi:uncharacterized protein YodC (DUF2158 family)
MGVDRSADLTPFLSPFDPPPLSYSQGVITAWNVQTGENTVRVNGADIYDVPMLNITEALVLRSGMVVGLLRSNNSYFMLGRIVVPNSPDFFSGVMPNISEPFYPQNTDTALQTNSVGGYYSKMVSSMIINHPRIAIGGKLIVSGATASGHCRVRWYNSYPTNGVNPANGTLMATSLTPAVGPANIVWGPVDYSWPAGKLGTHVYVSYEVEMITGTGGVDWVSCMPTDFYGHGN